MKQCTPNKAKRRPGAKKPSQTVKKPVAQKKMNYRPQGR